MILTENGFRFQRTGDCWRCVEHPAITMDAGGRFRVEGHEGDFDRIQDAVSALPNTLPEP